MPHRLDAAPLTKTLLFVLGFLLAFLPLIANLYQSLLGIVIALFAFLALASLVYALSLVGEVKEGERRARDAGWARWLAFSVLALGAGVGILAYWFRGALDIFIRRYVVLNTSGEIILASLLFLGVIMGVFVVRNWSKKQEDFVASLTAVLGGAFISTILSTLAGISLVAAFAHYALGFTVSGAVNLLIFARLASKYSETQSKTYRALIDFLYGSDKAAAIDLYFLKNFEADPDYAKRLLVQTLRQYREKVMIEFARKIEAKRPLSAADEVGSPPLPLTLYRLLSIQCAPPATTSPPLASPPGEQPDSEPDYYDVTFQELRDDEPVTMEMFRIGVAVKGVESLIYIVAPGEYRKPFPFYESVAGLALRTRQTIVMHRDRYKRFRHEEFKNGRCPSELEFNRGLDEIDYLSYISVPVVSRIGNPEEVPLGIVNVDTRLFAARQSEVEALNGYEKDRDRIVRARLPKTELDEKLQRVWASRLYKQNDEAVAYLEEMRAVIVPVLELYLKCQQGAS